MVIPVCNYVKLITQYHIQSKGMSIIDEVDIRKLLSQNIKRYRKRKGWSQAKLAEKMDISTNYLSDIERKKGWVSPFSLAKLANALEIEVFELFKPQEATTEDTQEKLNKCLEDFSTSLKVSFEKSIVDSMEKIRKNI